MLLEKRHEKREDFSDEPAEKKGKEDALEDNHPSNGPRERETYWERRKKIMPRRKSQGTREKPENCKHK